MRAEVGGDAARLRVAGHREQRVDRLLQPVDLRECRRQLLPVQFERLELEPERGQRRAQLVGGVGAEGALARHEIVEALRRRVELGFALLLAAAASGLALGPGFRERRRTYAIAVALGARRKQLGGFVWGEAAFVTAGGLALGAVVAAAISPMLVKVLTGVFDPPPAAPAVPWRYLAALVALTLAAAGTAGAVTLHALRRPAIEELREL